MEYVPYFDRDTPPGSIINGKIIDMYQVLPKTMSMLPFWTNQYGTQYGVRELILDDVRLGAEGTPLTNLFGEATNQSDGSIAQPEQRYYVTINTWGEQYAKYKQALKQAHIGNLHIGDTITVTFKQLTRYKWRKSAHYEWEHFTDNDYDYRITPDMSTRENAPTGRLGIWKYGLNIIGKPPDEYDPHKPLDANERLWENEGTLSHR